MRRLLLAAVLGALVTAPAAVARGEIRCVESLEWMAMDAPVIVQGKVAAHRDTKGPGDVVYRDAEVRIQEVIKGGLKDKAVTVRLRLFTGDKTGLGWKNSGHAFLFFLVKCSVEGEAGMVGRWTPRNRRQSIIDLDQPERAYRSDMKKARKGDEILKIVREYAKKKARNPQAEQPGLFSAQDGFLWLEIPTDSEIFAEIWAGSACYMTVPAEEKYRQLALAKARAKHAHDRAAGANMLRNYPGPETIKVLTALLEDPAEARWFSEADKIVRIGYPARRAAYGALKALGQNPAQPVFERKPTPKEILDARNTYWRMSVQRTLPEKWTVHTIKDAVEPTGWKRAVGSAGIAIECRNPELRLKDGAAGSRHPSLTLFAMPLDWQGENRLHSGEKLLKGEFTPAPEISPEVGPSAHYLGRTGHRQLFATTAGHTGWDDPHTRLMRYFGSKITNAYLVSTGLQQIIMARWPYRDCRTFSANGWLDVWSSSGDLAKSHVPLQRVPVPQKELEAIWHAALALDKETLAKREKPEKDQGSYSKLDIVFSPGRQTNLIWKGQEPHPDPKVRALVQLLYKRQVAPDRNKDGK